ncbi:MAG: insulinase family protein [Candidatus Cloacimonetes bacterium]|nr:insulinase family protein [Candidatus Cloacimonadota bacterium]MDD4147823.1 insulinase family protein [Candidatus Cloacimonadota bacterium]MDD4560294.1 insulinase family protein [Candidatus Cloacimonadota bacterium]
MKIFWISILCLSLSLAFAQLPEQIAGIPLPSDPDILSGKLENGITYYIMQNPKPANRAELRLFVDAGSIMEDDDQKGLAHFTEHMAFNGTQNFAKNEVVDYLTSIGMGYHNGLNAMTSYDFTMYELKIPTDNSEQLEKGFQILSDMAHQVSFSADELERERGVIIEEWRMGQGAQSRVSDAVSKVRFAGSRYAERSPIGTYEVLTSFQREDILRFYEDWYRPDLQSVVVIGDLPNEDALELVERYFGSIPAKENPRPREVFRVPTYPDARAVVATDPEYPYSSIGASWARDHHEMRTVGDYFENLKEQLFFDMFNERLTELTNMEDPPFSRAYTYSGSMLKGLSSTEIMAITATGRNREALRTLLSEAERIRRHGFQQSELDRAKVRIMRSMEHSVEQSQTRDSGTIVWSLFGPLIYGNANMSAAQEMELAAQLLPGIDISSVNQVIDELITTENLTISYTSIDKEGMVHPTEAELLAVYDEVMESEISPYIDKDINEPLMAQIPQPGKINKRKTFEKSGIEEWTLSNGIKVYTKKTDFKKDEILLSAKSIGGYSRYEMDEVRAAQILSSYLEEGGLGEFDAMDLSRIMAGKIAKANMTMGMYTEGFEGQASPKDLETLFQIIYLMGRNPRFDPISLNSFVNRTKPMLENQADNPEYAFFDSLNALNTNHHPMVDMFKAKYFDNLSLEQLHNVHLDRFADFSDFVFFIVGNYDSKELENYVSTYLASLPKARRKDKKVDAGLRYSSGNKEIRFQKGSSESAHVAHTINGRMKLNDANRVAMSATLMVLNEKLRENIRENLSGVYAIQAWQDYRDFPKEEYTVTIYMSCDPARVDELNDAIFATIDSLRSGLFDDSYVHSTKAGLQKLFEENLSNNRYWLNRMMESSMENQKADSFLNYPKLYDKVSKKLISKTARDYLNYEENKLSVIMTPEKTMDLKSANGIKNKGL